MTVDISYNYILPVCHIYGSRYFLQGGICVFFTRNWSFRPSASPAPPVRADASSLGLQEGRARWTQITHHTRCKYSKVVWPSNAKHNEYEGGPHAGQHARPEYLQEINKRRTRNKKKNDKKKGKPNGKKQRKKERRGEGNRYPGRTVLTRVEQKRQDQKEISF